MSDELTSRFVARRAWLASSLRRAFPGAAVPDVEDALQDMWLDLYTSARPLPSDPRLLDGLMRCVAWRKLRARYRRLRTRSELAVPIEVGVSPPGQELLAERWRWATRFGRIVRERGGRDPYALAAALIDKMRTHEPDTTLAPRHGIRRERLNGAWNALLEEMLPLEWRSRR